MARAWRFVAGGVTAAAGAAIIAGALASASATAGLPAAALFVDPFGAHSSVTLPGWREPNPGVNFPDRVLSVNGIAIGDTVTYRDLPAMRFHELAVREWQRGARQVTVRFSHGSGVLEWSVPLIRIDGYRFWLLVCVYLSMAACMAACGIIVFVLARHRPGGKAYVFLSLVGFLFLTTFVDYHTACWMVPIFLFAYGGNMVGIFWVAFTFPTPKLTSPAWRAALRGASIVGVVTTTWACAAPLFGCDPVYTRLAFGAGIACALITLAFGTLLRWWKSVGREREVLASALGGLVVVPVIIGVGTALAILTPGHTMQALIPLGGFFIPLSVGYALIKHNVFDTTEVLTRRLILVPLGLLALAVAALAWLLIDLVPTGTAHFLYPALACAAVGGLAFFGLRRGAERFLFGAARVFQPTIEQLSDQFALLREPSAIGRTIETLVRECLGVRTAQVENPGRLAELGSFSSDALVAAGRLWTVDSPEQRMLLVPMRSLGELRAVLVVGAKRGGSLFSVEDLALLDTLASLGAIALHNAEVARQLEDLRHLERDASREDKRLTLDILAAEISHEIQYPLNYFKFLLKQLAARSRIDSDEADIGREEVERLERMLVALRKLNLAPLRLQRIPLCQPVARAVALLEEPLADQKVHHVVEIDPALCVWADADSLLQVMINLLRNAALAAGHGGHIGVSAVDNGASGLAISVWDDGPGVPEELREVIFSPWVTTRPDGSGLGLPVALRIVRLHGWQITLHRAETITTFRITVPATAVRPVAVSH